MKTEDRRQKTEDRKRPAVSGFWILSPVSCLLLLASCATTPPAPPPPVRPPHHVPLPPPPPPPVRIKEVRAVWVSETAKLDWNQATAALQKAGFNTMYVNLLTGGAAFYPRSAVLPSLVAGDEVGSGIQMARSRGIAVHGKVIATFMFRTPAEFQQRLVRENRVMRGPDGKPILQAGHTWLCPSQPVNRDLIVAAVREMLGRYPVDGVQLDYIRFCEQPSCYCAHCRQAHEKATGRKALEGPGFVLWKQQVINDWMRAIAEAARKARPGIVISAAVFPDLERAKEEKAQDWQHWLRAGYVDQLCPMIYSGDPQEFARRLAQWPAWVPRGRSVIGVASWKCEQLPDLWRQITAVRGSGLAGFALFSYDDCAARGFLPNLTTGR